MSRTRKTKFENCPTEVVPDGEKMNLVAWKWGEKQERKEQVTLSMQDWDVIHLLGNIRKYCEARADEHRRRARRMDEAWGKDKTS